MALDIVVFAEDARALPQARELAGRLGAPLAGSPAEAGAHELALVFGEGGLSLRADGMELRHDFSHMARRVKGGAVRGELLVRAARVKPPASADARRPGAADTACPAPRPRAVDATAGFGEDALLLASAGFEVELYESDPVIAALLADGLRRAVADARFSEAVSRMRLHAEDSIAALGKLGHAPDVVLLDPMFPERSKSAAVKKKFQLLHRLERPCADETALLEAALAANPRKVVVKRPVKGPCLAGREPAYALSGKAVRYDVYVPAPR